MGQAFLILKIFLHVKDEGTQGEFSHSRDTYSKHSIQLRSALEEKKKFKNLVLSKFFTALYNYCSSYLQEITNH